MKPYEMRHERRLAALAQGQKPDGLDCYFIEIAQKFRPYMLSIALSILGNQDSAEDAVSEALLKAYVNLYGFTPEERESLKARAWLAEIVRNVCSDCRNNRKEEESLDLLMQTGYQVIAPPVFAYTNGTHFAHEKGLSLRFGEQCPFAGVNRGLDGAENKPTEVAHSVLITQEQ